ncbi:MAG: 50S ribosomal protein L11 methyltransferase [Wenzhouxiangella sp.]|nr:MAG: 50S ribosomal protein L11 methyltransferase [Wenzhouxiangella sp.]
MSKSTSDWLTLELSVPAEQAERAEDCLFAAGAVSVTLLDAQDHPLHEPGPGELPLWPWVLVQALFPGTVAREPLSEHLLAAGLIDSATALGFSDLVDRDWERAWMDQFRPMRFGRDLWICPSHVSPDPDWPLVVRLDPGLAFGSGTHPTTALCLEWIDSLSLIDRRVIDYGCGSGVLAIAAALKGARTVFCVDHDPQALAATRDNAERNGVGTRISAWSPAEFSSLEPHQRRADVVVANILAGPLVELAPSLAQCIRPGGQLVLSGILAEQAAAVAEAYRDLDPHPDQENREGWVRLVFQRRDDAGYR